MIVILVVFDAHNYGTEAVTLHDLSYTLDGNGEQMDAGYIPQQALIAPGGDHVFNYTFTAELSDTGLDVTYKPAFAWTLSGPLTPPLPHLGTSRSHSP